MAEAFISAMSAAAALTGDELLEVSQLSSTVAYTATTLSALASDNSYNDSASQFIAEGFAVGDRVKVAGFTGNVVNNVFAAKITALTTAKMTIGGTDGDVIVDDAAGESVTIKKWETHRTTAQEIADLATGGIVRVAFQVVSTSPTANEVLCLYPCVDSFTFPANFSGSEESVITNPTASFAIDVQRQVAGAGAFSSIGTITVGTGGAVTFATASGTSKAIAAGDVLKFLGDSDGDATFIGAFNLKGII